MNHPEAHRRLPVASAHSVVADSIPPDRGMRPQLDHHLHLQKTIDYLTSKTTTMLAVGKGPIYRS